MILAIDPGRSTGWALSDRTTGTYRPSSMDDGDALAAWWRWLADMITERRVAAIVVERAFFTGRARDADWTPTLIRSAHAIAAIHEVPRAEYPAVTVRMIVLGRGNKWPDNARVQAARDLGFRLTSDHAADAALLLRCFEIERERAAA